MLTSTLFDAPIYKSYGRRIAEKKNGAFTKSRIPENDIGWFIETAQSAKVPTPIAGLLHELLDNHHIR